MNNTRPPQDNKFVPRKGKRVFMHRKVCRFCADKNLQIDFKDSRMLRSFITERGKILSARITGTCAKHQRCLTAAIKQARNMALLPVTAGHALLD